MSWRENAGAVLGTVESGVTGDAATASFFELAPAFQFRYRKNAPTNTTIRTATSGNAPIPLRDSDNRLIPSLPAVFVAPYGCPLRPERCAADKMPEKRRFAPDPAGERKKALSGALFRIIN
jgi:hypothetical protein